MAGGGTGINCVKGAGGGGGGGLGYGSLTLQARNIYYITIGDGGVGGVYPDNIQATNGNDSSIIGLGISETAYGGGYGGCGSVGQNGGPDISQNGGDGGSGGGVCPMSGTNQASSTNICGSAIKGLSGSGGSSKLTYLGNSGGSINSWYTGSIASGSGGGGAYNSGASIQTLAKISSGSNGGSGYKWIDNNYYAGGGGGGCTNIGNYGAGTGGLGGGGGNSYGRGNGGSGVIILGFTTNPFRNSAL